MSEKTQTFEFETAEPEKPVQNRSGNDEYSEARRNKEHLQKRRKEEKGNRGLVVLAIILAVLLIAAIVAGIFILKQEQEPQSPIEEIIVEKEEESEEEPPEVQNVTLACNIVFYPESVITKDGSYTVLADLYDDGMYKFDNRKLIIDGETDIRQDGKRLTPRAVIYIIENSGGDMTVFKGEVNEADGKVLSLEFEAPVEEEVLSEEVLSEEVLSEEVLSEKVSGEAISGEIIE